MSDSLISHGLQYTSLPSLVTQMVKDPPAIQLFDPGAGRFPWRREWELTPYSCLENPMDLGAWWVQSIGLHKIIYNLKRLSVHAHAHTHVHIYIFV